MPSKDKHGRLRMEQLLVTPREAARALSIGRSTLYQLLANGSITAVKIGRARRIPAAVLREWINSQAHDVERQTEAGCRPVSAPQP